MYWEAVSGPSVLQGDFLPGCLIPEIPPNFAHPDGEVTFQAVQADFIIVTQSCDLSNDKAPHVALCAAHRFAEFVERNPALGTPAKLEEIRRGKYEALHMLGSQENENDNQTTLIAHFGLVVSLPIDVVKAHAASLGRRYRLNSPYLEHFSQAFARFFMRVGLPSAIPRFR